MTGVLGCLFRRNMVIGLKMAALNDGTDPPPHSLLFPTEGLNQECGISSASQRAAEGPHALPACALAVLFFLCNMLFCD